MAISKITPNTQDFPTLGQTEAVFESNTSNLFGSYLPQFETEFNNSIDGINDAIINIDEASDSADIAIASANNKGLWSNLTGALNIPASVNHNNSFWVLNTDLVDVTLSEPKDVNTDWTKAGVSQSDLDLKADKANPVFTGIIKEEVSVSTLTLGATSSVQTYTATADFTIVDDLESGENVTLVVVNAGFTPTYPTITWWDNSDGTTEPTLGTTDEIKFYKIGTTLYGKHTGSIV